MKGKTLTNESGAAAARVGRFALERELGRGAQGAVWLARDTRLDRLVALKTLHLDDAAPQARREQIEWLLAEARIASQLAHPNIVTLYDAGEELGVPYLVFELVEGRTLAARLRAEGQLPAAQAVRTAIEILRGVAAAHTKDVVHRDLKPANVMLTTTGTARIMDFGIARRGPTAAGGEISGTPSYMAPEYISGEPFTPQCDVFSVGMMLYEMLTGSPAVARGDPLVILQRIVAEPFAAPSQRGAATDERLDAIVLKALEKAPGERYASAAAMIEALERYLDPTAVEAPATGEHPASAGTVEFLLRRMRHKSDFPVLSGTISSVNKAVTGERQSASVLCNTVLKDFALTNKLLKLVNAAHLAHLGGSVSTVSRAVAIIGFDRVRDVALSLVLFEHLQNRSQAGKLREEVAAAYLSAVTARSLVKRLGIRDAEEAYLCGMFHRLGRLLTIFYLHDEAEAIARLAEARGGDDARAAREVLGVGFEELGRGVAKSWNLPGAIVDSMQPYTEPLRRPAASQTEKLRALASLASALADAARMEPNAAKAQFTALADRFGQALGVNKEFLVTTLGESAAEVVRDAEILGLALPKTGVLAVAQELGAGSPVPGKADRDPDTVDTLVAQTTLVPTGRPQSAAAAKRAAELSNRRGALTAGLQDITQALAGDFDLNDLLRIILETMYRSIGFKRVVLCIRDPRANSLRARFGFGGDIDDVLKAGFAVPLEGPRDVFYAAISQGADVCIEDADAEKMRQHIPEWLRERAAPRGFLLLPIKLKQTCVALIYADADAPETLRFDAEELGLLKALRNQAVLAIKQRS